MDAFELVANVGSAVGIGGIVAGAVGGGFMGNALSGYQIRLEKQHHQEGIDLEKLQHTEALRQEQMHHKLEMDKAQLLHDKEIAESRRLLIAERNTELKQHFQQLNADLINSNREAERDMYEQRNSQFQTIIVSSTVMFGALCTVIIEGNLPTNTAKIEEIVLMACSGMSFAFLFVCIILSLKVILRSSHYMYKRASAHNNIVNKLAVDTMKILDHMDNDMKDYDAVAPDRMWEDHVDRVDRYLRRRQDFNEMLFGNFGQQKITPMMPRLRADSEGRPYTIPRAHTYTAPMTLPADSAGHAEYVEHIPEPPPLRPNLSSYSQDSSLRSIQIAEQKALLGSFEDFWADYCQSYAKLALRLFYLGIVTLLVSLALLMYAKLQHTYHNTAAAFTFASFIFISIVGTVYVLVVINNNVDPAEASAEPGRVSTRHLENLPRASRRHLQEQRSKRGLGVEHSV